METLLQRRWRRRQPPFNGGERLTGSWQPLEAFNGATALRRWKPSSTLVPSASWNTFNGATALRRWKPRHCPRPRSARCSFNGATALRRWKRPEPHHVPPRCHPPSMEPPPFGDGNVLLQGLVAAGFKPSMEPPPFGDGNSSSWFWVNWPSSRLQWSHRPSAMETPIKSAPNESLDLPSMEPPPFGDGNLSVRISANKSCVPSMEPPPFGDGNARP